MHPTPTAPYYTASHKQSICMISRLTCFSIAVVLTFVVCMTLEFTFVLKYSTYVTPDSSLRDYYLLGNPGVQIRDRDDWRQVTDDIFVYSAYWDRRTGNKSFVRIIGGAKVPNDNFNSTKCLIKFKDSYLIEEFHANYEILIEHHNKPDRAIYIKCLVNNNNRYPSYVAIVPIRWNETWAVQPSWMVVQNLLSNALNPRIGICVRPMFNYSDTFRISEFVAYYEALGVSHFMFYNYNASDSLIHYLQALKNENYSVDVLPWSLPPSLNTMWSVGQLASINDCVYRSVEKYMYIVIVDLDEFITPRHVMTLQELLQKQDIPGKNGASFILRSCVFCAEYPQDVLPPVIQPFRTQSSIRRESFIYPFLVRSKYIVKPFRVVMAGVHHVWSLSAGWEERYVPASQALVHHYRDSLCVNENKTLEEGEIDVKSRKYLNHLMRSKVVNVWKNMFARDYFSN